MKTRLLRRAAIASLAPAVMLCSASLALAQGRGPLSDAAKKAVAEAAARPTPKAADGHPDLSGTWAPAGGAPLDPEAGGPETKTVGGTKDNPVSANSRFTVHANEEAGEERRKANYKPRAEYKPQFQEKVKFLADHMIKEDPSWKCMPKGVPRIGAPQEIVQKPKAVFLLYAGQVMPPNEYRIVPTDGRARDKDADPMPMGESLGHWEGDTLVVESANFDDSTWIDGEGAFHGFGLKATERFTRKGNTLTWEATAFDPDVMVNPIVIAPRTLILGPEGSDAEQDFGCVEADQALTTNDRH